MTTQTRGGSPAAVGKTDASIPRPAVQPTTLDEAGRARVRPLVLVVEDQESICDWYMCLLAYSGFDVECARNGQEAVAKAISLVPDLILMDLFLPIMDGWEATSIIRGCPKTERVPVIAVTAYDEVEHLERARRVGCSRVLVKPCEPDVLMAEIRQVLDSPNPAR